MIPKVIHYCWFSGETKPLTVQKCIASWKKYLPDYTIKCWTLDDFDNNDCQFLREAIENRKWAFASDYIRLYALYHEGGIYLDSDVQAWGSIDDWLQYDFFSGIETRDKEHNDLWIEAAIMGSISHNPLIGKMLDLYKTRQFVKDDGTFDQTPIPTMVTPIVESELGWKRECKTQVLSHNSIVFGPSLIANTNTNRLSSVRLYHLNNMSWRELPLWIRCYRAIKNMVRFIR